MQRLEAREAMADKAEAVTHMTVTVFTCKEVSGLRQSKVVTPLGRMRRVHAHTSSAGNYSRRI